METSRSARRTVAALVLAGSSLGLVGTAHAEGSWSSNISGALTGFNSRTWTDKNLDANATTIRFEKCEDRNTGIEPDTVEVQLTRETPWYQPDENRGRKTLACEIAATGNWGRQGNSNYHFTVTKINGNVSGGRVDVNVVKVAY